MTKTGTFEKNASRNTINIAPISRIFASNTRVFAAIFRVFAAISIVFALNSIVFAAITIEFDFLFAKFFQNPCNKAQLTTELVQNAVKKVSKPIVIALNTIVFDRPLFSSVGIFG